MRDFVRPRDEHSDALCSDIILSSTRSEGLDSSSRESRPEGGGRDAGERFTGLLNVFDDLPTPLRSAPSVAYGLGAGLP